MMHNFVLPAAFAFWRSFCHRKHTQELLCWGLLFQCLLGIWRVAYKGRLNFLPFPYYSSAERFATINLSLITSLSFWLVTSSASSCIWGITKLIWFSYLSYQTSGIWLLYQLQSISMPCIFLPHWDGHFIVSAKCSPSSVLESLSEGHSQYLCFEHWCLNTKAL